MLSFIDLSSNKQNKCYGRFPHTVNSFHSTLLMKRKRCQHFADKIHMLEFKRVKWIWKCWSESKKKSIQVYDVYSNVKATVSTPNKCVENTLNDLFIMEHGTWGLSSEDSIIFLEMRGNYLIERNKKSANWNKFPPQFQRLV